ncbi:5-bromo-4-chloroindolyl phosphate hydrolysis family protein [Lactococcus nasutitermitis]|uniref:5-bromo-4-chloroindolyl phosphate hydrolysis family protein n=1 Tax=Lactococcus nasutitermitis TaxID=1652957 RepID=A0ABV9JD07_9LACT|nr:5-bromo-4-chloroindolyl phosphate hydrolysis family protein [Lactococcus nasutitermitis]
MNMYMMNHTGGHLGFVNLILGIIFVVLVIKIIVGVTVMHRENKSGETYKDKNINKKENIERYHDAGLSDSDIKIFRENLAEAKSNIETWEKNLKKNDDLQVVESVTGGLDASKHTFKYIVQNPQELTKQNDFLYKDLPNMVKLTDKYLEMKKQSVKTEDIERDLDETLLLIKTLSSHISKNYHEILMDDVNIIKHEVTFD